MGSVTDNFIEYLFERSQGISQRQLEKARDCLCDYLAVTRAGAEENRERWAPFLRHAPAGVSPVIGTEIKTDGKTACLVNGFNAHSLELDDGQRFGMIHLGAAVISAVLSAKSENEISQKDLLTGIIMGYEAACRVAVAAQPSHKKRGFHAAGTCGTIGAAAGTAFALRMRAGQLKTVLPAAVAGAAGLLEIQEQKSELKPYNLGRAAMDGLSAAYMGFTDFAGPEDILGGERGFLQLFADGGNLDRLTEEQPYFEIERIYVKPYAACRHCHSAIEAALTLREQAPLPDIEKIAVYTYHLAVKGHDHTRIAGTASAKLSIPYSVAAALVLGRADVSAFRAENVNRADILRLTEKVSVAEVPEFTAHSPQKRIARVEITLKDGRVLRSRVDHAKGDPENPMSRDELKEKVEALVGAGVAAELFRSIYQS